MSVYSYRRREEQRQQQQQQHQGMEAIRQLTENCEKEKMEKESWEQKFHTLQLDHETAQAQLDRSNRNAEKLRTENKSKSEQLDKLRRDLTYMEDRMRNLEHRATEVANLEIAVENLKKNLEQSQTETREAERHYRITEREYEQAQKKLCSTENTLGGMQKKMDDLKLQVKEEVIRNSALEERVERHCRVEEELEDKDKQMAEIIKETEAKTLQLQHCRKCLREEKDKNSTVDGHSIEYLKEEHQILESENNTLKSLLSAKDGMLVQRSNTLENIRNIARSLPSDQRAKILRILDNKDQSKTHSTQKDQHKKEPQNGYCSNRQVSHHQNGRSELFRTLLETDTRSSTGDSEHSSYSSQARPMTASPTSSKGGYRKSFVDFRGGRQDDYNDERWASASPRVSYLTASPRGQPGVGRQAREATAPGVRRSESMRVNGTGSNRAQSPARPGRPQSHYGVAREPNPRAVHRSHTLRGHPSDIHSVTSPRPGSVASSATDQRSLMSPDMTSSQSSVMSYTPEERCLLIASCLEVGSRVAVSLGKRPESKKPTAAGLIKYIGPLDSDRSSPQYYVGLLLDESVGDTNGVHNGRQYFYVDSSQGKLLSVAKVLSVMNKNGRYMDIDRYIRIKSQNGQVTPVLDYTK